MLDLEHFSDCISLFLLLLRACPSSSRLRSMHTKADPVKEHVFLQGFSTYTHIYRYGTVYVSVLRTCVPPVRGGRFARSWL
jgi:hypothetical protein